MDHENPKIYMDAVLRPNRSMSPRAFTLVMVIVGLASFLAGMAFISMGAFPVLGFLGLDAFAIWMAFRLSFRQQRAETHIRISAAEVDLRHYEPGQSPRRIRLPTSFVRVALVDSSGRASELQINHGQRTWVIGRFLTASERTSLCQALQTAIRSAKKERYPSDLSF